MRLAIALSLAICGGCTALSVFDDEESGYRCYYTRSDVECVPLEVEVDEDDTYEKAGIVSHPRIGKADLNNLGDPSGAEAYPGGGVELVWDSPIVGKIRLRNDPSRSSGFRYTLTQDGELREAWDEHSDTVD